MHKLNQSYWAVGKSSNIGYLNWHDLIAVSVLHLTPRCQRHIWSAYRICTFSCLSSDVLTVSDLVIFIIANPMNHIWCELTAPISHLTSSHYPHNASDELTVFWLVQVIGGSLAHAFWHPLPQDVVWCLATMSYCLTGNSFTLQMRCLIIAALWDCSPTSNPR